MTMENNAGRNNAGRNDAGRSNAGRDDAVRSDAVQGLTPAPVASRPQAGWTGEKTAWWIVFAFLVLGIFFMLGLWN